MPAAVLRAGPVIGAGTVGFEVLRHLTDRMPVMVTPRWAHVPVEPVAVGDLLHCLVAASGLPQEVNRAFDVGGPEALSCAEMIRRYAAVVGLRGRRMLPIRAVVPRLSVACIAAVTPVPTDVARSFVRSFLHEPARRDRDVDAWLPAPPGGLTSYDAAVARAVADDRGSDPGAATGTERPGPTDEHATVLPTDPSWAGRACCTDTRTRRVRSPVRSVWRAVDELGRAGRWPPLVGSWAPRGANPRPLRVESRTDGTVRLGVIAEVPGSMWLELSVIPHSGGGSVYHQRAVFEPRGLAGIVWWRVTSPVRGVFLAALVRDVVRRAGDVESGERSRGRFVRPARGS